MTAADITDVEGKALFLHRFLESHKMAHGHMRAFLGDPDFVDPDVMAKVLTNPISCQALN